MKSFFGLRVLERLGFSCPEKLAVFKVLKFQAEMLYLKLYSIEHSRNTIDLDSALGRGVQKLWKHLNTVKNIVM
jgi:hypothetical protein